MSDTRDMHLRVPSKNAVIFGGLLLIGLVGAVFSGMGLLFPSEIQGTTEESVVFCGTEETSHEVVVSVIGAVQEPGVYVMRSEDRVADLLEAAGGLHEAAQDSLYESINLAERLVDGQQLVIQERSVDGESDASAERPTSVGDGQKISLNFASQTELETLPGIGEKRAEKIIESRPYGSVDELREWGVVSDAIFEDIKNILEL